MCIGNVCIQAGTAANISQGEILAIFTFNSAARCRASLVRSNGVLSVEVVSLPEFLNGLLS